MWNWRFDVALSSHDLLQRKIKDALWVRIVLSEADWSRADARLVAAQFAHAMHGDMMVTAVIDAN